VSGIPADEIWIGVVDNDIYAFRNRWCHVVGGWLKEWCEVPELARRLWQTALGTWFAGEGETNWSAPRSEWQGVWTSNFLRSQ